MNGKDDEFGECDGPGVGSGVFVDDSDGGKTGNDD